VVKDDYAHEFDDFYRRSSGRAMGQAYAMTGNKASAEDLVQEAFGRAWRRWVGVRRLENREAWVRRVMLNQAISDWRKASRPVVAEPSTEPRDEPDLDAIWLAGALRALPRNQCRAIVLHDAVGLTVPEVARELHVPTGTVKSWIFRGHSSLALLLADSKVDVRDG